MDLNEEVRMMLAVRDPVMLNYARFKVDGRAFYQDHRQCSSSSSSSSNDIATTVLSS